MPAPGLVAVAGGKYTTYRVMARDAVDAAARGLDRTCRRSAPRQPLVGADGFQALWNRRERGSPREHGAARRAGRAPARRYGALIDELLAPVARRPELGEPLAGRRRLPAGRGRATPSPHEGALHLDDVLTRRTRISIETLDRGLEAAERPRA